MSSLTHLDARVVLEKLVSYVLDPRAGVRDVAVGLPVPLRRVGVAGCWRSMGHSGGRHKTHRLPCEGVAAARLSASRTINMRTLVVMLHVHTRVLADQILLFST